MDELTSRAFGLERRRTTLRLTEAIADIREQLSRVEDAIVSGKPLAASSSRQVVSLAGDAALAAGALDILVEWGKVFASQNATEGDGGEDRE